MASGVDWRSKSLPVAGMQPDQPWLSHLGRVVMLKESTKGDVHLQD